MERRLFIVFLSLIYLPPFLGRSTLRKPAACDQPFHCANIPSVTPPFWNIGATHLPCRGHPAFALDCRGAVPFLLISGLPYRVLEIDFFRYTLKVARHDLWNNLCRPVLLNTTLTPDVFQVPPDSNYTTLTLYYNCSGEDSRPPLPNQFRCRWSDPDRDREVINLFKSGDGASTACFACSKQITVPVTAAAALALDQSPSSSAINVLRAALAGGFLIQWSSEIQWSADIVGPRILQDISTPPPGCSNFARSSSNCTYNATLGRTVCSSNAEAGNKGCEPPGPTPVTGEAPPPPVMKEPSSAPATDREPPSPTPANVEPPQGSSHKPPDQRMIILGSVFGALAFIAACVLTYWCCKDRCLPGRGMEKPSDEKVELGRGMEKPSDEKVELGCGMEKPSDEKVVLGLESLFPKQYKHEELEELTNKFSDELGRGGYGKVYKGTLPDGSPIAVKLLFETEGDSKVFSNEVLSISQTSHVNIVKLLGFCNEGNKRALVYKYMPNESLDKLLSKDGNANCPTLDMEKLYNIAIGVAEGLKYLHRYCNSWIVHFDIKPQNILLDENFIPKIADFGLAKLGKSKESKISMRERVGTAGYMAPEIYMMGSVAASAKSDVYSYGMMVLDMVGARDKVKMEAAVTLGETYFPDIIYEEVKQVVSKKAFDKKDETKMKLFLVGFWCIQRNPSSRPDISKVLEWLQGDLESIGIPPKPE